MGQHQGAGTQRLADGDPLLDALSSAAELHIHSVGEEASRTVGLAHEGPGNKVGQVDGLAA